MQKESLDKLNRYINDVLDYSRNKRMEITSERISVEKMIKETAKEIQPIEVDNCKVNISAVKDLEVSTDPLRFKIILNNLISNAFKYKDTNKSDHLINIKAGLENELLNLEISDNGAGIKKDFQDRIWNMFFRASSIGSGSGLGLYIVKEAVGAMSGQISVDSEEGKGSVFRVSIPVSAN